MLFLRFNNVTFAQIEYRDCKKFNGQKRTFNGAEVLFFEGFARVRTSSGLVDANIGDWVARYENGDVIVLDHDKQLDAFENYEVTEADEVDEVEESD